MEHKGAIIVHLHRVDGNICIKGTQPWVVGSAPEEFFLTLPDVSKRSEIICCLKFRTIGSIFTYTSASLWDTSKIDMPIPHHYTLLPKMPFPDEKPFVSLFQAGYYENHNVFVLWTDMEISPLESLTDRTFSIHRDLSQLRKAYPDLGHLVDGVIQKYDLV